MSDFEALRLPQERLQLALDAGAIAGTWFWDVVADRFTADARFARCLSLDERRMEAGVRLAEVVQSIHPDDEPRVRRLISEALSSGGAYRAEYRVRQSDGAYRWIEANGKVTLDLSGHALTFTGVLIDTQRRKVAELKQIALLELGDQLRGLTVADQIVAKSAILVGTATSADRAGYGVIDEVGEAVDIQADWRADAAFASVAGVHRFRDFGSFIEDLLRGEVVCIADVSSDPRTAHHEAAFRALGIGSLLNVPLMRDGQLKGVLFVHGVKPRQWTAEEAAFLRSAADRTWAAIATVDALSDLRALNDGLEREIQRRTADRNRLWHLTRDLMLIAQFDGKIVATNPAWKQILGWDEEDLVDRAFFDLIHPDDRDKTVDAAHALGDGALFSNFENRYRHKDGSYRWISWSASPGDGLIVAAGRDVSDAKSLQVAEDKLRQSQKMEALGQLTGGVAHDFNNLLTVISTSVALLRRQTTSDEQRTRSIDAISKTVFRAAKLTGQLLAFARRQALTPTVFDVGHNINAIADMIGTLVGVRILLDTSMEDGSFINADPGQFDTAVVNMAVNARDAMAGAGRLAIKVWRVDRLPAIRTHPAVMGDFVAVSIADSGTGIEPENVERIFEPFYTTKAMGHGTGLGLSQVFGFVKQSGGELQVESRVGEGTTFTLYFPRATPSSDSLDAATSSTEVESSFGATVLVVEDNLEVASAVEATLNELGYRTRHAIDAAQALKVLEGDRPAYSAVFSDVVMAGMDGVALAREIRRRWPDLGVVLTSGYSHVLLEDTGHGFELLAKPYDIDALARVVRRATSGATVEPANRGGVNLPGQIRAMLDDVAAETRRQAELDSMQILDTSPEDQFDDLVRMAADVCGTPIALVSLIDRGRQWFKAKVGLEASETPREVAFCAHAIQHPHHVMVVEDATKDRRFAANPLVTGNPNIRFYAGAPLLTTSGEALGTLCVISPSVRDLEPKQEEILQFLADQVVKRLELRRAHVLSPKAQ